MFTNRDACTIYEKTVQNRAPVWIRHTTGAIYWEETDAQAQSGTDRSPADAVRCLIPAGSLRGYVPKPDDRIVSGSCEEEQPPKDAPTVTAVRDFRYGSPAVQHVEVTAT